LEQKPEKPLIIAIDGFSSCGKSTLAKQIAKELHYVFVDSGAMYRAATLFFIENSININYPSEVQEALNHIKISFQNINGINTTFLNNKNVEDEIRSLKVSEKVSEVSAISAVRRHMVELQRKMKGKSGLVMDGRDIGTVVFPDADIKLFITADPIVRAQRRFIELVSKDQTVDLHEIISNLAHRDKFDTERVDSPLLKADDAVLIDNTHLSIEQQFDIAMNLIVEKNVVRAK